MKRVMAIIALSLLTGCTTVCRIDSNAHGADVYLDGVFRGKVPCDIELSNSTTSYVLKVEHPDYTTSCHMISQIQNGTASYQQQQTTVNANSNMYGRNGYATGNTFGTVNQNTQTQTYATYAWTTRYYVPMIKAQSGTRPAAQNEATTNAPAGAFCPKCGERYATSAQFCSGCGARR